MQPLDRALQYITSGWHLIPCHSIVNGACSCGKAGCHAPGKHPRTVNGIKDASRDEAAIRRWWTDWPDANIALATGKASGVWVLDIDPRHGGFESMDQWESDRGDPLPQTLVSRTGGGGRHLFFVYPSAGIRGRNPWLAGVDVKSDGGYVILPESTHISGGLYQWENYGVVRPAQAPSDLIASIQSGGRSSGRSGGGGDEEIDFATILAGVPEGKRNDTLFRAGCRIRRQHSGDSDGGKAAMRTLLMVAAANAQPPYPAEELDVLIDSVMRQNHNDVEVDWEFVTKDGTALHALTDLGNAYRFAERFKGQIMFVPGWGWCTWRDKGWVYGDDARLDAKHYAETVPDVIRTEAVRFESDPDKQAKLIKWAQQTESASRINAILNLAEAIPELRGNIADFDSDPLQLACANGLLDLRTGELRPFTPEDMITKNTGVAFNPDAKCGMWERFLAESASGDVELIQYLQLAAGYTLTGLNSLECFFIISGRSNSGKSTYIDAISTAMGTYATATSNETFTYRKGRDTSEYELARFPGIRLVTVSEIPQGDAFNEPLVKQITGGDEMRGRVIRESPFTYKPQCKIWIATNHDPDTSDQAMRRRVKKIDFDQPVPKEKRDPRLKERFTIDDEGKQAILAWMVAGAVEWQRNGRKLKEPQSVINATEAYFEEQDMFGRFLHEVVKDSIGNDVDYRVLFNTYRSWCALNSVGAGVGPKSFRSELKKYGLVSNTRDIMIHNVDFTPIMSGSSGTGSGNQWT